MRFSPRAGLAAGLILVGVAGGLVSGFALRPVPAAPQAKGDDAKPGADEADIHKALEAFVAAFNESDDPRTAATGALIGIVVACVIGWGIYQGGLRINLARFFRVTGVVLVFVAAGLVASALHSAHEAGWVTLGQQRAFDLTWLL